MIEIYNSIYNIWLALFPQGLVDKYLNVFEFLTVIFVISIVYFVLIKPIIRLFQTLAGGR